MLMTVSATCLSASMPVLGLAPAAVALEVERPRDDGDGHGAQLARDLRDHGRAAGAGAAALAGGDEHEVGAAQGGLELVARDLHGLAPDDRGRRRRPGRA